MDGMHQITGIKTAYSRAQVWYPSFANAPDHLVLDNAPEITFLVSIGPASVRTETPNLTYYVTKITKAVHLG